MLWNIENHVKISEGPASIVLMKFRIGAKIQINGIFHNYDLLQLA